MLFSIVVPVYNSERTLSELYNRIKNVFDNILKYEFEMILVDDSSKDNSFIVMMELSEIDDRVKIVQLTKNFGQHNALMCGFSFCDGDYVITLDDDLQHIPEEIPKLIHKILSRDDLDVVIGAYERKKHGPIRNFGTYLSNSVTSYIFGKDPGLQLTSFRIMRKIIVNAILKINVGFPRVGHLILKVSNRIENVEVKHDLRKYGKSGYTFKRLVKDFFSNIFNNSAFPLIALKYMGICSAFISAFLAIYYICRFIIRGVSITGWTTLVILILLFSGSILLGIGILGEYLYRTFEETKHIPNYFIRQKRGEEKNG